MSPARQEVITAPVLVLVGPTAIGKTSLSLEMARRFSCEIISVDSMQVYRYMDIGTAKPSIRERKRVAHHLIDIINPDQQYNAAKFVDDCLAAITKITAVGKIPLLTGGTGLYLKALTQGLFDPGKVAQPSSVRHELNKRLQEEGKQKLFQELKNIDPKTASRVHPNDTQRIVRALEIYQLSGMLWSEHIRYQQGPAVNFEKIFQIGLTCNRKLLYDRIEQRTLQMMENGLVKEVEKLREMKYSASLPSMQAIGYRHVNNFIDGKWGWQEAVRLLIRDTRRYAKRQMTWFAKIPSMTWFNRDEYEKIFQQTDQWLNNSLK